jgi:hypothetical protein
MLSTGSGTGNKHCSIETALKIALGGEATSNGDFDLAFRRVGLDEEEEEAAGDVLDPCSHFLRRFLQSAHAPWRRFCL